MTLSVKDHQEFMELCREMCQESVTSLAGRPTRCRCSGNLLRPPDQEEVDEVFFKQLKETSLSQAVVIRGC